MRWLLALLVSVCLSVAVSRSDGPAGVPPVTYAVVRIKSHGASATVIYTEPGRSLLLGCAHAYRGQGANAKMALDVQSPTTDGRPKRATIKLLAVDHQADLSLVELGDGPLPYVAPVAPAGHRPGRVVSAGYDDMIWPATVRTAHITGSNGLVTYTRERPWHGRSGGGLLDAEKGYLIGVVSGYTGPSARDKASFAEVYPGASGIYVSHEAVIKFLKRYNSGHALDQAHRQVWPTPRLPQLCPT